MAPAKLAGLRLALRLAGMTTRRDCEGIEGFYDSVQLAFGQLLL